MVRSYDITDTGNIVRLTAGAPFNPLVCVLTSLAGATVWKMIADRSEP